MEPWAHSADNRTLASRADPGTDSPHIPRANYVYILSNTLSIWFLIILVCILKEKYNLLTFCWFLIKYFSKLNFGDNWDLYTVLRNNPKRFCVSFALIVASFKTISNISQPRYWHWHAPSPSSFPHHRDSSCAVYSQNPPAFLHLSLSSFEHANH